MKIRNIHDTDQWFEVLETTPQSQTAVMVLAANEDSSHGTSVHHGSDQVLYVVEGEVEAEIGDMRHTMRSGDSCIVRAGTPHRFENRSQNRVVTFNVYSPPEYAPDEKG